MSFEFPERALTKEEWTILTNAATDKAGDYRVLSGQCVRDGEMSAAKYWAKKANKIFSVLISIENEYYKTHPNEDPDKEEVRKRLNLQTSKE